MKSLLVRIFNKYNGIMLEPRCHANADMIYRLVNQQVRHESDLPFGHDLINDGIVFMQCTGKEDKNGKLIYDGDIIRGKYIDPDTGKEDYQLFRIEKDEKWCTFAQIAIGYDYEEGFPEYDFEEENVEVVGNIWQTPELLKGGECQN